MNIANAKHALVYLHKYVEAGEKGYAIVASNVRNGALRILYRAYAQQRLKFKEEIFDETQRLGAIQDLEATSLAACIKVESISLLR